MKIFLYITIIFFFSAACLTAQTDHKKNSIEISHLRFNKSKFDQNSYNSHQGQGTRVKLKRTIYQNDINRLSFGITAQRTKANFWSDNYDNITGSSNGFNGQQNVNSIGLLAANRFFLRGNKISFFMDVELDLSYQYFEFQDWEDRNSNNIAEESFKLNNLISSFGLQTGLEFHLITKFVPFIAVGISQNINTFFKPTSFLSVYSSDDPYYFAIASFTFGIRF